MSSLEEVARRARVSPSTVSRAIARPERVAIHTRERVLEAVRELGYQPNEFARSLRSGGSRSIGLIVTDLLNPFHATLAKGVQDAADRHDLTVFLFNSDEKPSQERRALETLRRHHPRGLIIVPTGRTREHPRLLAGLTVVELDRASGLPGAHTVMVDNEDGARRAVQHLIALGHQRIAAITGDLDVNTSVERLEGYRAALQAAGLPQRPEWLRCGHHREQGGHQAARELLTPPEHERPTALFVTNSEMTLGALLAARALGLSIPRDVSLVGFDDSRWAQVTQPAVSVVAQPTYDLGFTACETLLSLLRRGPGPQATSVRLATTFVPRESTGPPIS